MILFLIAGGVDGGSSVCGGIVTREDWYTYLVESNSHEVVYQVAEFVKMAGSVVMGPAAIPEIKGQL